MQRHFRNSALGLLAVLTPAMAWAREDAQLWTGATAVVNLGGKWRLSEEVIARFSDRQHGLYQIESNTLVGFKLTKNMTFWAGYTHNPNYAAGRFTVMEHRGREQITLDNIAQIGRGRLSARLRIEQRWREGVEGTAWRLRPYVKYTMPLGQEGSPSLNFSHESFINLNTTDFQRVGGEQRMRNLLAIAVPVRKNITAELGYLNQHGFVPSAPDRTDHIASVALSFAL